MKYALADPNWSLALQPVQVKVSPVSDLAYVRGTYVLTASDPASKKVATERAGLSLSFASRQTDRGRPVQQIRNAEAPATIHWRAQLPNCRLPRFPK